MVFKADKLRLRKLLMDAISLLCKNGLPVQSAFRIEATIGITLSEDEVVLVSFREVVQPDKGVAPQCLNEDEASDEGSGILTDGDDIDDEDTKKAEEETSLKNPSQSSVHNEMRDELEEESGAWSEVASDSTFVGNSVPGNSATVGNSATIRNSALKKRPSAGDDDLKCPSLCPGVSYEESHVQASCSSIDQTIHKNTSSFDHSNHKERSNFEVQIKDEVIDDEDCTFVKMEDGAGADVFDPLVPDDSWMYQVYNETNLYNTTSNELPQFVQGQDYNETQSGLASASHQSWTASSREIVRSSQSRRSLSGVPRGGGLARGGVRQSLPVASRNQDRSMARTLQSLCKTLANQACSNTPGEPVFCHICGARLSSNATLVKHIKGTHLALSACQCDICGQSFKWTMQLCRHRKRYHSNIGAE